MALALSLLPWQRLLGVILLLAAGLKSAHLSGAETVWAVVAEVILSLWLSTGLRPKSARLVACLTFMLFLALSLNKALAGQLSCGCFGALTVNPWLTAGCDAAVVAALGSAMRPAGISRLWLTGAAVLVAVSLGAAPHVHSLSNGESDRGEPIDPRQWLGGHLELPEGVWAGRGIDDGEWFVAFYTPGCAACRTEFDRLFEAVAERKRADETTVRVAVIEVPAGEDMPHEFGRADARGRLAPGIRFLAPTPLILEVRGGVVVGRAHSAELVSR